MKTEGSAGLVTAANGSIGAAYIPAPLQLGATKINPAARRREPITNPRLTPIRPELTRPVATEGAVLHAADAARVINNAGISTATPVLGNEAGLHQEPEVRCSGALVVSRSFGLVLAGQRRRRLGYGGWL